MTPDQFVMLRRQMSGQLSNMLTGIFQNFGSWHDPDATRYAEQVTPLVAGAQRTLGQLTAVYIADQASNSLGATISAPLIPDDAVVGLRRVSPIEVYRRPFVALWKALSKYSDLPTAIDRGADRLRRIVEGDMQQAHSGAARAAMESLDEVPSGWRRVLVGTENCALCVLASTRLYSVGELNPLHHNCNCRVEPAYGDAEPDHARAEQVKTAIAELGTNASLRRLIVEHGELGPLLVRPNDHHLIFPAPDTGVGVSEVPTRENQ